MRRLLSSLFFKTSILLGWLLPGMLHQLQAQPATGVIRGLISDNTGPLPGATVLIAGTQTGAIADANGRYRLTVAPGTYTLTVTFVGYARKEVKAVSINAGTERVVDIQLGSGEGNPLQEVTVSYGRQRRREITGSVATLDASLLQDMPVQQFAQQLQGKIAGVSVQQSCGQPGRGADFQIRGAASFYSDNQPLFVVDGLPLTGSINNINPNEIESYSVLNIVYPILRTTIRPNEMVS